MYALWFLICIFYGALAANNCNSNKCYQTVNNSHTQLIDLISRLNTTSSQAEVFKAYDLENIKSDLKEAEKNEKELNKTKASFDILINNLHQNNQTVIKEQSVVTQMLEKVFNISQYNVSANNISKEAGLIQKNLEDSLYWGKRAAETCTQARGKYAELKKIVDELVGTYESNKKIYDNAVSETNKLNENIKETFQETVRNKNNFDQLELPENLVQDFLIKTENSFNQTIKYLKEDVSLLKDILNASQHRWNEHLKRYGENVSNVIADLERNITEIKNDIEKYEQAFSGRDTFTPTVNDESRNLLRSIKESLNKVRTKFDKINFSDDEKRLLLNETNDEENLRQVRNKRQLIKVYKIILKAIPITEEKILKIAEELKTLRLTISLYEKWRYLNDELVLLRKNRDKIVKINCTAFPDKGSLT